MTIQEILNWIIEEILKAFENEEFEWDAVDARIRLGIVTGHFTTFCSAGFGKHAIFIDPMRTGKDAES